MRASSVVGRGPAHYVHIAGSIPDALWSTKPSIPTWVGKLVVVLTTKDKAPPTRLASVEGVGQKRPAL